MSAARVAPGDLIGGRYQIEALLGEGGMAVVYRARHIGTGRPCALKLVHAHLITKPHLVEMFIREAQVGSKIGQNPHIVDVFDAAADETRRVPYLVMELLEGQNLERYVENNGPMAPGLLRELFDQLGDALGQAHRAGVVHRDLKPSNLFLTADHKGQPLLKVLDFGIAKVLENDNQHTATQIGTPSYAAPEQFGAMFRPLAEKQGITISAGVSAGTDVWAMGLIAYELLTGAKCGQYWDTQNLAELPIKATLSELEPASRRAGDRAGLLPPGFDAWFARCLRKNAPERWPSAGHAVAELGRILSAFGAQPAVVAPSGPLAPGFTPAIPPTAGAPGSAQARSGYMQGGAPPAYAATPPPNVASGPFTPGPYTSGPPTPGPYTSGPPTPGPYSPGPSPSGSYPPGQYGPGAPPQGPMAYPPGAYPQGAYPQGAYPQGGAPGPAGPIYLGPQGPQMPLVHPPRQAKPTGGSPWLAPLIAVGLVGLSIVGTFVYYGVKRYRVLTHAHACDKDRDRTHCEEACDGQDLPSCTRLGALVERGSPGQERNPAGAAPHYRKACDGGDQPGCANLGRMLLSGRGVTRDAEEGKRLVQKACDAGVQRGCTLLGELLKDGDAGMKRDEGAALVLIQSACDAGDMLACKDLGGMAEYGQGGLAKNVARAATLYQQACEGGEPTGCNDLGVLVGSGKGFAKDPARATGLYKQACEGGEPIGCSNQGMMYEWGNGVAKDEARALALYTQSCDQGSSTGCARLGVMHEYGKGGLTKDLVRASALYKQSCDASNPTGCFDLGTMEESGKGVPQDYFKAVAHYKVACDGGNASGCNGLGVMTEGGRGGLTKDDARAGALYKQSCESGVAQGCSNYGLMLAAGRGVARDHARAASYFKQACDSDNSAGCSNLGYQYVNGLGLPRDRARGLELLRKGCSAGYDWGCDQLKAAGGPR